MEVAMAEMVDGGEEREGDKCMRRARIRVAVLSCNYVTQRRYTTFYNKGTECISAPL